MTSLGAPSVGAVLGDRYELVRLIARGGMAEVFEAEDRQLRRRVAVKLFRSAASGDRARFDAEVVVLAGLNHPGLVKVFDAGEEGADAYVVLELVEGSTLRQLLADGGPLPPAEVADLGAAVSEALAYVHERGVVHRDVTPSNVICGQDGRPRLADFGIARLVDTTRLTATATSIGTAAYMAPEQVQGHDVTPVADVYALGLVLFELLTGGPAFTGTAQEVAVARLVRAPDVSVAPVEWQPLLTSMTERAHENRPSAAEVQRALTVLGGAAAPGSPLPLVSADRRTEAMAVATGGTSVMPTPVEEPEPVAPGPGKRVLLLAAIGLLLIVLVAAAASSGGLDVPPATTTSTIAVPEPAAVAPPTTTPTTAPVAVVPEVTEPPKEPGKGHGGGGDKKGDDEDEADD